MKKILLTGFEPFHSSSSNPTQEIVLQLQSENIEGLFTAVLPVEFGESARQIKDLIDSINPDVVLALGQAESRSQITPEKIAINLDDARIPDNAGNQPRNSRIISDSPDGLFTTLPIERIVESLKDKGIDSAISLSAGTYVCNHLFYSMQNHCLGRKIESGFIHVPLMDSQATEFPGLPTMPLPTMITAVREIISLFN